jgi:hypothetical protein
MLEVLLMVSPVGLTHGGEAGRDWLSDVFDDLKCACDLH